MTRFDRHAYDRHLEHALPLTRTQRRWTEDDGALPALYLGHGAPPLLDDALWLRQQFDWAQSLPKPRAVLIVSAHWENAPLSLSGSAQGTPLVYDFGGFEQRFYEMTYETPDASDLARTVASLVPDTEQVHEHVSRGLDHGAWVPLKAMYPDADVPVLQMSLPTHDPEKLLALGRRLRPLREQGVLVIGSGFLTHGLPFLSREHWTNPDAAAPGWSVDFDAWAGEALERGDVETLARYSTLAPGHAVRAPDGRALLAAVRDPRHRRRPGRPRDHDHRRLLDGPVEAVGAGGLRHPGRVPAADRSPAGATGPVGRSTGVRVVELAGIGPAPYACMLLADLGADVVRVDRVGGGGLGAPTGLPSDVLQRGRRAVAVDLKQDAGRELVLRLVADADVLVEGFRPGVTERMRLGPHECLAANPSLVYGRMTGWGQDGPLATTAGHDVDYVAVTGALAAIGTAGGPPAVPANLLGDFGGGSTFLVMGVLAALVAVRSGGPGQVVDAAIVDGVASLTGFVHGLRGAGAWTGARGENLLDGGAPFYGVYACAGGGFVAVGALEPQFYAELVRLSGDRVDAGGRPGHAPRPGALGRRPEAVDRAVPHPHAGRVDRACSRAPTPASPRCSTGTRRPATRTWLPAARWSSATVRCNPLPHRGSRARRRPSAVPRWGRVPTPTRCWPSWA